MVGSSVCAFLYRAWMTQSEEKNHYVTWKIVLYNNLNTPKKKKKKKKCIPAKCFSVKDEIRNIHKAYPICQIFPSITACNGVVLTPCVIMTQLSGRGRAGQGKLYYQHLLRNGAIFTTPGLIKCLLCLPNTKHCNTRVTRKGLDWQLHCLIKIELPEG